MHGIKPFELVWYNPMFFFSVWNSLFPKNNYEYEVDVFSPANPTRLNLRGREKCVEIKLTRPSGPIFGASVEVAPTSPPMHLKYTINVQNILELVRLTKNTCQHCRFRRKLE